MPSSPTACAWTCRLCLTNALLSLSKEAVYRTLVAVVSCLHVSLASAQSQNIANQHRKTGKASHFARVSSWKAWRDPSTSGTRSTQCLSGDAPQARLDLCHAHSWPASLKATWPHWESACRTNSHTSHCQFPLDLSWRTWDGSRWLKACWEQAKSSWKPAACEP